MIIKNLKLTDPLCHSRAEPALSKAEWAGIQTTVAVLDSCYPLSRAQVSQE
jgi:hypothetical protein